MLVCFLDLMFLSYFLGFHLDKPFKSKEYFKSTPFTDSRTEKWLRSAFLQFAASAIRWLG